MSTEVLSPTRTNPRPSILEPLLSKSTASLTATRPRQDSIVSNANSVKSNSSPESIAGRSSLDGYESEGTPQAPPIPGFVVASSKRNADFHELFPNVPEMDYLVQDYGCAWHREILIQGRLYISENHLCFYANIFGWITSLTIPFLDILGLDKRMTAYVIPNAILVTTHGSEYTFASFLTRDTVYDVMQSLWHPSQPPAGQLEANGSNSTDNDAKEGEGNNVADQEGEHAKRKVTECACGKDGQHYPTIVADYRVPGTPEKLYELLFKDPFMEEFLRNDQKLLELQIGEWAPKEPDSILTAREMSFIKPLNASIGPKKTKCEIKEEVMNLDFEDYVSVLTTTRTPDVPNGNIFSVKTRLCLTWAGSATTRLVVTSAVEWTARSFIKGVIDRSAIDGQKQYHQDLEKAMRQHIAAHRAEFVPEGAAAAESESGDATPSSESEQQTIKQDAQTKVPGMKLDWGAMLDMVQDAFSQAKRLSSTQALVVLVVVLALSNIWSLLRPAAEPRLPGDAQALKARKKSGKKPEVIDVRVEIRELRRTMEAIEMRLERIESSLNALD